MERLPFAQLCPNSPLELPEREGGSASLPLRHGAPGKRVRSTSAWRHATSTWAAQLAACQPAACGPALAQPQAAEPLRRSAATTAASVVGGAHGAVLHLGPLPSAELPADWLQGSPTASARCVAGVTLPGAQCDVVCSSACGEHAVPETAAVSQQRGVGAPGSAGAAGPAGHPEGASPGSLPAGDWAAALLESWDVRWEALLSPELREAPEPGLGSGSGPEPGPDPCAPSGPPAAAGSGRSPLSELLAAAEAAAAEAACANRDTSVAGNGPAEARMHAGASGAARVEDGGCGGSDDGLALRREGLELGGGCEDTDDLLAALLQEPRGAAGHFRATLREASAAGAPAGAVRDQDRAGGLGPAPRAPGSPRRDGAPVTRASPDVRARAGKRKCSRSPSATSEGAAPRRSAAPPAADPVTGPQKTNEGSTLLQRTAASSSARADSLEWEPGEWPPAPAGRAAAAQGRVRLAARLARVRTEVRAALPSHRASLCVCKMVIA